MSIEREELDAIKSDGSVVKVEAGVGVKLAIARYYVPFSNADASWLCLHVKWDATIGGTITIEDSCMPRKVGSEGSPKDDVKDIDASTGAALGNWMPEILVAANIPVTAGGAIAANVLTITSGTAGGAIFNLSNIASRRQRVNFNVTTGGVARFCTNGKMA